MSKRQERIRAERFQRSLERKATEVIPASPTEPSGWSSWWRAPKPTEWILAIAALIGGVIVFLNGSWEGKKSEAAALQAKADTKEMEVTNRSNKLALDQIELEKKAEAVRKSEENATKRQSLYFEKLENLQKSNDKVSMLVHNQEMLSQLDDLSSDNKARPSALFCNYTIDQKMATVDVRIGIGNGKTKNESGPSLPIRQLEFGRVFAVLKKLRNLHLLEIDSVKLISTELEAIADITTLNHLYLTNCDIDDRAIEYLRFKEPINYLALNHNPISRLPMFYKKWALQLLDITGTKIGDEQLVPVLKEAINLMFLNADLTSVTDRTLEAITKNKQPFRHARLARTNVTRAGLEAFIKRIEPKYLVLTMSPDRGLRLDTFIKTNNLKTGIIMHTKPLFEEEPRDGDMELRGYSGNHIMLKRGNVDQKIHLVVGELAIVGHIDTE